MATTFQVVLISAVILAICFGIFGCRACQPVDESLQNQCNFYQHTTLLPKKQKEAGATIKLFELLFLSNCSSFSRIFVCSTFLPFCHLLNSSSTILPCCRLCTSVRSFCLPLFQYHRVSWPVALNCSLFPASSKDLCLAPPTPTPSSASSHSTSAIILQSSSSPQSSTPSPSTPTPSKPRILPALVLISICLAVLFPLLLIYVRRRLCPQHPPPESTQAIIRYQTDPSEPPMTPPPPPRIPAQVIAHNTLSVSAPIVFS